jgi:hypothetical protein
MDVLFIMILESILGSILVDKSFFDFWYFLLKLWAAWNSLLGTPQSVLPAWNRGPARVTLSISPKLNKESAF